MTLSLDHLKILEDRTISDEWAIRLGVYTGRLVSTGSERKEVVEDQGGNILCFPYYKNGNLVGTKYRTKDKRMWQSEGGCNVFYNHDAIARSINENAPLVITEGEFDCLAVLTSGYHWAVSIPSGSLPGKDSNGSRIKVPDGTQDIIPDEDRKFSFLWGDDFESLLRVKRIVLALDNDDNGLRMRDEMARRLGKERCYFIDWGNPVNQGPKDFNDVLGKYGPEAVLDLIDAAKPYPVNGVYKPSEIPAGPPIDPISTGFKSLDDNLKIFAPSFMVVTGRAGHGKSAWTTQMVTYLARNNGWKTAIASFEMAHDYVLRTISCVYHDKAHFVFKNNERMKARSDQFIEDHFVFITPNPDSEAIHDIEWLLDKARVAVVRHGIKVLLIDPWNEIEHQHNYKESTTEYTNRAIMLLKRFARDYGVLVIVVAHPTKSGASKDASEMSLYDISDSAAFQNKADFGVVVSRKSPAEAMLSEIFVTKVRYQPDTGKLGSVVLTFDSIAYIFNQ
jgi:twinkle protein